MKYAIIHSKGYIHRFQDTNNPMIFNTRKEAKKRLRKLSGRGMTIKKISEIKELKNNKE